MNFGFCNVPHCKLQIKSLVFTVIYDIVHIVQTIIAGENFLKFGLQVNIKEYEIIPDALTSRLLMYYPWETDTRVPVWINPPEEIIPM